MKGTLDLFGAATEKFTCERRQSGEIDHLRSHNPKIRKFGKHYVFILPLEQDLIPLMFQKNSD
ncbi:hypothetical protein M8C21_022017, partial [Ambrosia artemisiifolia]